MPNSSAEIFIDSWRVYEKVVAHNYMYHDEFHTKVKIYLEKKFGTSPINILDLGCGDASGINSITENITLNSYRGYDLSGTALEYARAKFKDAEYSCILVQKDIREAVKEAGEKYEVVYSSYALHHLSDEEKQKAFTAIYSTLVPGGVFIYIDIFRPQLESREEYLQGYITWIYSEWHSLKDAEKALISNHVLENDYPASEDWMKKAALNTGFYIFNSPVNFHKHQLWLLEKE